MFEGIWVKTMACMSPILSATGEAKTDDMPERMFAPKSL